MASELLFPVHLKVALAIVDHDFVVHRLACKVLHVWMHRGRWDGVHIRLTDVLCHYRDAKLPDVDLLVVCSRDEASPVLDEGDRVDRPEVLLVLLDDVFLVSVKLKDFFV